MADESSAAAPPDRRLRQRAEAELANTAAPSEDRRERSAEELVHELQVHQIELEVQNEELRQARLTLELARDRYADLYDFAPLGYFTFNSAGLIVEANLTGARLLGIVRGGLIGRSFDGFVDAGQRGRWTHYLARVLQGEEQPACELTLRRPDGRVFVARADSVLISPGRESEAALAIRTAVTDISDLKQAEQARAVQAERLNQMARRLAAAQEEERKHLSAELHDRTSPNLAALRINLANIIEALPLPLPEFLETLLDDTSALVDDATASIREICAELRPPVLDYAGVLAAIESYAQQFGRRTGIAVSVDGARFSQRPTLDNESMLFRIAVEALTNCAKHAHAQSVRIVLANEGRQVVLSVADDGIGFDERRRRYGDDMLGQGLVTMRERAEFAGASFRVESAAGRGTRIEVRV